MKFLVIGNGGREHAIIDHLNKSINTKKIYVSGQGNPGINQIAEPCGILQTSSSNLADFALKNHVDYTIVGPEQPLADGIADLFREKKLKIFGPGKDGAKIESSKVFAKDFMKKYNIPTADYEVFYHFNNACSYIKNQKFPIVIKADGLAAGKGVIIAYSAQEAESILKQIMTDKIFGSSGDHVVIEEFLEGQEISILTVCDGSSYQILCPAQDHKQAYDGDKGPNTGGMGAYSPVPFAGIELLESIKSKILTPALKGFQKEIFSIQEFFTQDL